MTNPDRDELVRLAGLFFQAIVDGYKGKIEHGFLIVENPDASPERIALGGVDPNLVLDAKALLIALRRLASSDGGVKVRELEWPDQCQRGERVHCKPLLDGLEQYCIAHYCGDVGTPVYRWARAHATWSAPLHTYDAAKVAAQADYEARIRSALAEVPAVKGEPEPVAWPANLNPRTLDLVQRFALALAKKLRLAEEKYGHTDGWLRDDWEAECRDHLYQHLEKGDPRDVAAYCAFMWHHGWITYRPEITAPPADAGMREALERAREAIVIAISFLTRDCGTDRINKTAESLVTILVKEDRAALAALTALGATTKSDGGERSWPTVDDIDDGAYTDDPRLATPLTSDPSPTRSEVTCPHGMPSSRRCSDCNGY